MSVQTLTTLYTSPRVDLGHILSMRDRVWAPDDADIMNADMPLSRCHDALTEADKLWGAST